MSDIMRMTFSCAFSWKKIYTCILIQWNKAVLESIITMIPSLTEAMRSRHATMIWRHWSSPWGFPMGDDLIVDYMHWRGNQNCTTKPTPEAKRQALGLVFQPLKSRGIIVKTRASKTFVLYVHSTKAAVYCPSLIIFNWRRPILTSLHQPIKNTLMCKEVEMNYPVFFCLTPVTMPFQKLVTNHCQQYRTQLKSSERLRRNSIFN